MRGRAVKVCEKAGIGRKGGHKKPCFLCNFSIELSRKRKCLIFQINFCRIGYVTQRKLCFLSV